MIAKVDVASLPAKECVQAGGYDVLREGRNLEAWPISGEEQQNLRFVVEPIPDTVWLVLAPVAGESEYPIGAYYSEQEAIYSADGHPEIRVREVRMLDAWRVNDDRTKVGPVTKAIQTRRKP